MFHKPIPILSAWGILGFYRGINEYDYNHEKRKKLNYLTPEPYLYSCKIANGFTGCLFYVIPPFLVLSIPTEIYRLEVNLRGMESEKLTDKYNRLI